MTEDILFQFNADYRVARKNLIFINVVLGLVIGSAFFALIAFNLAVGIVIPIAVYFVFAIRVALSWEKSTSYMVSQTRVSFHSKEKSASYFISDISNVRIKPSLFGKDRLVSNISFNAKTEKGVKKVTLKYLFDAQKCYEYLSENAGKVEKNG